MRTEPAWSRKFRWVLLILAACLTLLLLGLDRYAAFAHRPGADSKTVVIYTTAWCPYCEQCTPDVTRWYEELRAGETKSIEVVLLSADKSPAEFRKHLQDKKKSGLIH